MLFIRWQITEGEYENRLVFQTMAITHSSEKAQKFGREKIKDLCSATGVAGAVTDASIFLFKPVCIKLCIEKDKNGVYADKNVVKRVMPLDGSGATATSVSKPATAAKSENADLSRPAQPPTRSKSTTGPPPWARNKAS